MKQRSFDLLAVAGIFAAYTVTIRLALGTDLAGSLLGGLANTIPVVIFGLAVRRIVLRWLIGRPVALQLGAHLLLCTAFAILSYWLLIMLLGLFVGASPEGFVIRPFKAGAAAWQTLENVTTYALIAAISHLQAMHKAASAPDPALAAVDAVPAESAGTTPSRYFVRIGDELRPLDLDTVVSIGGADDYAEVRTLSGKHLVRVTLTEFARSLDPAKFARVHRSWIVNTHRIASAEPAGGGRLLLHLENGQTVSTSRDGARLLRDRVI